MQTTPDFSAIRIIVVGDVMLDRYWQGAAERISPEAPVPVIRVQEEHACAGGAGNVALNLAKLGVHVTLLGVIGDDEDGATLTKLLEDAGVETHLIKTNSVRTICKLRVVSQQQQLCRLDFEEPLQDFDKTALLNAYEEALKNASGVILSDYAKGTLSDPQALIARANLQQVPIFIDPKGQRFERYRGATLLTPNRREFEAVVGECNTEEDFASRASHLLSELSLDALLVTRGREGMSLYQKGKSPYHLTAIARDVFDVTGAGDTVIAVLSSVIAATNDIPLAMRYANTAAGIVISRMGAATVSATELHQAMPGAAIYGVLAEEDALERIQEAKKRNEKIVMTNGCFDVIHEGHVRYLAQAKALGQRLIVAVNDDASVKRLKGDKRPVNSLNHRMTVLAALADVDWVVSFSEDTPERVINVLSPDILVKGGDYKGDNIAGQDHVLANGGEVKILDFFEGLSSSHIITRINEEEVSL